MFADGLTISFEGFLSLVVTAIGIWFVVQQLREAKLASQMEGLISLSEMYKDVREELKPLQDFMNSPDWDKLDGKEAYTLITENKDYYEGWLRFSYIFTLLGNLVYSKALDIRLASRSFGYLVPLNWNRLEKVIIWHRKEANHDGVNYWWEWLAKEFMKLKP